MTIKKFGNKFSNVAKFDEDVYRNAKSMKIIGEVVPDESYDENSYDLNDEGYDDYEERLNYQEYMMRSSPKSLDWV